MTLLKGLVVLRQLELDIEVYYASEIDENANKVTFLILIGRLHFHAYMHSMLTSGLCRK